VHEHILSSRARWLRRHPFGNQRKEETSAKVSSIIDIIHAQKGHEKTAKRKRERKKRSARHRSVPITDAS
jgi:hypothetical protein